MGRDPGAFGVPEFVLQRLGEGLHRRLRGVVGGIARRRGDPLLRAGVDDEPRPAPADHAGGEDLGAVDDPPEVHVEDPPPGVNRAEHRAAGLDAGVVHQHVGAAEAVGHRAFERLDRRAVRHVGVEGQDLGRALGPHGRSRIVEKRAPDVDEDDAHAPAGEFLRRGEADARGASGDDGDGIGGKGGMGHGGLLSPVRAADCPRRARSATPRAGGARNPAPIRALISRTFLASGRSAAKEVP